jgi:hypothetical protein
LGKKQPLVPTERIEPMILHVRGHKVMLDADLATLYAVETKVLVQAMKRRAVPGGFHVPTHQERV